MHDFNSPLVLREPKELLQLRKVAVKAKADSMPMGMMHVRSVRVALANGSMAMQVCVRLSRILHYLRIRLRGGRCGLRKRGVQAIESGATTTPKPMPRPS